MTKTVSKLLKNHKHKVDQEYILRARLFDILIGDWDRHDDQWRWGEFKEDDKSQPNYRREKQKIYPITFQYWYDLLPNEKEQLLSALQENAVEETLSKAREAVEWRRKAHLLNLINQIYINNGVPAITNDAANLEIEFIPTKKSLNLEYIFASEEYCDYVGSQFTDKIGIFLAGPGIQGPFSLDGSPAINLAEFTNAAGQIKNVDINNINNAVNPELYVDNNTVANASSGLVA